MKKQIATTALMLVAVLSIGYYRESGHSEMYTHIFVKKAPTFQIKFENIFANYKDHKKLSQLTKHELQQVADYCKYRLGIETQLKTQDELDQCKKF